MDKYILRCDFPAGWHGEMWREALPAGNGEYGASVYGGVHEETIMLTHSHLWWKSNTPPLPDISDKLPQVRRLLLGNEPFKADKILSDRLQELSYNPQVAFPLPLCDLSVVMDNEFAFSNYERSLDMHSGEISVCWEDGNKSYSRRLFVSRSDNVIVYNIAEKNEIEFNCELSLKHHDISDIPKHITDIESYLPTVIEYSCVGEFLTFIAQKDDGEYYGCVAKILSDAKSDFQDAKLIIKGVANITVLIKLFVGDLSHVAKLKRSLQSISDNYDTLLEKNKESHGRLMSAATLNLFSGTKNTSNEMLLREAFKDKMSLEMIEKMWNYGRYLLISSSKTDGLPCHLYGLWCGSYEGYWAFNMANENLQMIYWHALSGNMSELLLAVFNYVDTMIDDFKTNAKKLFGCRGIYIPAPTTPESGLLKIIYPHIIHYTAAAGWIAQHYYDYYLFTKDITFLKERALPFMEQVALFYEDFLIEDEHGRLMAIPSNSPENTPGNYWDGKDGMGQLMETTINSTMDIAIIKELLSNIITGANICGMYKEKVEVWETMLDKLPKYEINEDGAIKEWIHEFYIDNYRHRHQSHCYPLFPGNEIHEETHPELYKAFVTAIDKRLCIGLNQQSGWSLVHMANNYTRMKKGNSALECLNNMAKSCVVSNFFTLHNDWRKMGIGVQTPIEAPVQLDANMGFSAAINEMLVQSFADNISILPALPDFLQKGSVTNLLTRCAVSVSISWDRHSGRVEVLLNANKRSCKVNILFPNYLVSQNAKSNNNELKNIFLDKDVVCKLEFSFK